MKKINVFILFFIALFLIFSCGNPSENLSSKSNGSGKEVIAYSKKFTTTGLHIWEVPENITGSITICLVGGGGGGGAGSAYGGGGGAGEIVNETINLDVDTLLIDIGKHGSGGSSGSYGNNGESSKVIIGSTKITARAGDGEEPGCIGGGAGGNGYPDGKNGHSNPNYAGDGGNNELGYGKGGGDNEGGDNAPANSGGGGGGADGGAGDGGDGGSGYVKIEYTVAE